MSGPTAPVRIGLVGYGKGGRFFSAPLIDGADGCELAGVVARSAARRADLAADRPGVPAYAGLAELAASGVDAVVVTTPLDTHAALVREAIDLGLRHRSGASSHVVAGLTLRGEPRSRFRVVGTEATCVLEDDDGLTDRLLAGRSPADDGADWGSVPPERWGRVWRAGSGVPVPSARGAWSDFCTGFARAVRGQGPVPVDPRDAVAVLEVLDAARESAGAGRVVAVGAAVSRSPAAGAPAAG